MENNHIFLLQFLNHIYFITIIKHESNHAIFQVIDNVFYHNDRLYDSFNRTIFNAFLLVIYHVNSL